MSTCKGCGGNCGGNCDVLKRMVLANAPKVPDVQGYTLSNCKQYSDRLTRCQLDRLEKTQSTPTIAGVLTPLTNAQALDHFGLTTPAGLMWHLIQYPGLGYAHRFCQRELTVLDATGAPVPVTLVGLAASKLFCDPSGQAVTAWDWAATQKPLYISTTQGHCACDKLCVEEGVAPGEAVALLVLLPAIVLGPVNITADGYRDCWGKAPGPCPPDPLCGRTFPVPAAFAPVLVV